MLRCSNSNGCSKKYGSNFVRVLKITSGTNLKIINGITATDTTKTTISTDFLNILGVIILIVKEIPEFSW
jgi:hypothetical protein